MKVNNFCFFIIFENSSGAKKTQEGYMEPRNRYKNPKTKHQWRLNRRVFRIREYKSVGGHVKQMREKTGKLKITKQKLPG